MKETHAMTPDPDDPAPAEEEDPPGQPVSEEAQQDAARQREAQEGYQ